MKKADRHTKEHRKEMLQTKKDFERYLTRHTGYFISLEIVKDATVGYCYRARVSLNPEFNEFASYILKSSQSKKKLSEELRQHILSLDLRNKKNGQSIVVAKKTASSPLTIDCAECQQTRSTSLFHRHLRNTDMFKGRGGHVWLCKDCASDYFVKVMNKSTPYHALYAVCAIYDRPFNKSLADTVISAVNVPGEIANQYFKRLNLSKFKHGAFSDSEIFINQKI